ncbi:MAG: outer rane efflux protein [Acidobacteria bacterium]|nr:outer rane efflux protein [Acidobacteriota bacterium]
MAVLAGILLFSWWKNAAHFRFARFARVKALRKCGLEGWRQGHAHPGADRIWKCPNRVSAMKLQKCHAAAGVEVLMKRAKIGVALQRVFCVCILFSQALLIAQTAEDSKSTAIDYSQGPDVFPNILRLYQEQKTPAVVLDNSPRLGSLIRDGKLELTLADAIALALENNLDIAVQRLIPNFAQIDVLRTKSGQAARGFQGASIPGGLTSGALGAGVSGTGTGAGVGNAGGISGGGGAVSVASTGTFDPSLNMNFSWDRATTPLNTIRVSGIPVVKGVTTAFSSTYSQLFQQGASYSISLSGQRQSSTQRDLLFNPAAVTRFSFSFNQPLLNGAGFLSNQRFIRVARNNLKVSEQVFRQQVVSTIVLVENAYWDLAAQQQNVRVAEQSLSVSDRLLKDNQIRLDVGTMSPLDVTSAESEVAARTRDLTIARTNLQLQEANLKNILSKNVSAELDKASIVLKDPMPEPKDSDIPATEKAIENALENRPDFRQAQVSLENQDIALKFTKRSLLPNAAIFGFYAGAGLQGDTTTSQSGIWDSFTQSFKGTYPEYAGGVSMTIPFRNRVAQADSLRTQLEANQIKIGLQRSRSQIELEVRKAIIGLIQGKAQVEAAHQAVRLARAIFEGEQSKLDAGASTSYQVILRERDLIAAQQAEVIAVAGYSKARVEMDRSMGRVFESNSIEYSDALSGTISKMPVSPFAVTSSGKEGK